MKGRQAGEGRGGFGELRLDSARRDKETWASQHLEPLHSTVPLRLPATKTERKRISGRPGQENAVVVGNA